MAAEAPVDLAALVKHQLAERYRSVLVIGDAAVGKSRYAQELAEREGLRYVDLLALFEADSDLAVSIDRFGRDALLKLLRPQADEAQVLVVDNADFLLNAWTEKDRRDFADWLLNKLDDIACPEVLCFFVQADGAFHDVQEGGYRPTTHRHPRVVPFGRLVAL
jgi:hypothetical protein